MTILEQLAEHAKERVEINKKLISFEEIKSKALEISKGKFEFEKALYCILIS